jgi:hypothetical protein
MKKKEAFSAFSLRPIQVGLFLVLGLMLLTSQAPKMLPLEQILHENRDKKRVVLLVASTDDQDDFKRQKALLMAHTAELAERDMLVVEVLYSRLSGADQAFLARKIGGKPKFAVVLIGKDGGVKLKSAEPIIPARLFETVDTMPMRRQEMRRRTTK